MGLRQPHNCWTLWSWSTKTKETKKKNEHKIDGWLLSCQVTAKWAEIKAKHDFPRQSMERTRWFCNTLWSLVAALIWARAESVGKRQYQMRSMHKRSAEHTTAPPMTSLICNPIMVRAKPNVKSQNVGDNKAAVKWELRQKFSGTVCGEKLERDLCGSVEFRLFLSGILKPKMVEPVSIATLRAVAVVWSNPFVYCLSRP